MVQTISDRDILLREVHHRVKNNLQIISSILNLQAEYSKEKTTREVIRESQDRIRSIALLHEEYYQSENFNEINIKNYIHSIGKNLLDKKNLQYKLENKNLSFDTLIPVGLLITEVISYFKNTQQKLLLVKIHGKTSGENYLLSIQDNNPNRSIDEFTKNSPLISKLIYGLCNQIDAKIEISFTKGLIFNIHIPLKNIDL